MQRAQRKLRRGTSAVEFAVVAPVFLLVVFALIEFSRFLWVQQALTNAAREGARKSLLATTLNSSDVDAVVRSHLQGTIRNPYDSQKVRVLITPSDFTTIAGQETITTTVVVDYEDISLLPPNFLKNLTIAGSAAVERE